MKETECKILRSKRKTYGLEIKDNGLIMRAPLYATDKQIREFMNQHREWIDTHMQKVRECQQEFSDIPVLTMEEIRVLADKALVVVPERVRYYAQKIGVTYGRITIRNQRTRWGSCSAKGNLNFNCLLMLAPPEVLDSVVVHELCHRKEMNHSDRFYAEVLRVFPDYRKWNQWLKDNGDALLKRMS